MKSCPKSNKSPNLVPLMLTREGWVGWGYHDLYLVARDCDRLTIPTDKEEWRNEELHNDQSRRTTLPNECSLTTPVLRSLHIFGSSISRIFGSSIRYETSYKSQLYLKDWPSHGPIYTFISHKSSKLTTMDSSKNVNPDTKHYNRYLEGYKEPGLDPWSKIQTFFKKKWANSGLFLFIFGLFKQTMYFLQQINAMWKMSI